MPFSSRYYNLMERVGGAWRSMWHRRAQVAELEACGRVEVERMAQDLGLSGQDLRAIAGREDGVQLLRRRMAELNLDPASIDSALMRDLERTCSTCDSERQCQHDLDTQPQAANWPAYCPNSATLEALAAMKCH